MRELRFVIGIGSQRAGTTLLHRILDECTDVFMHPIKELHYFDTLFGVRNSRFLVEFSQTQVDREFDRLIEANEHGYMGSKRYKCYLRTNWILSRTPVESINYLDLYRPCLQGRHLVGEITPEYMIVPDEGVQYMAECIGKDALIILLSRDPVERFISSFKLLKMYGTDIKVIENFDEELRCVLEEMPTWIEQQRQLSDYQTTLSNYKKYFDNVCLLRFEDLIRKDFATIEHLETFLGVKVDRHRVGDILSTNVNQIGETGKLSSGTMDLLQRKFESETRFLERIE